MKHIKTELPFPSSQHTLIRKFANPHSHHQLITGGGTGIGSSAARVWAHASALGIIILGRRIEPLEETALQIRAINAETKVLVIKTDVSIDDEVKHVFQQTHKVFGRGPDVVLLCAAVLEPSRLVHEMGTDEWWGYMVCFFICLFASCCEYMKI